MTAADPHKKWLQQKIAYGGFRTVVVIMSLVRA